MLGSFGSVVLAVAALAIGGEDASLLRLGIIAGLWAALLGAFAVARMHRDMGSDADRAEELRTVYQLELEREIAARHEHERTVERELREQIERRERADLAALRGELQSLRDTLKNLLGGDVLVERVALRAESTRLLPLSDHPRTFTESRGRAPATDVTVPRSLTAASSPDTESRPAAQPRPVAEPSGDASFLDRSWRPAIPRTPSWNAEADAGSSPSWRRRAESDLPAPAGQAPVNGASAKASEPNWESPIWNSLVSTERTPPAEPVPNGNGSQSGSQSRSQRGSPAGSQSPGAHRGGRSVSDLLAAYGKDSAPPSRRRRRDG